MRNLIFAVITLAAATRAARAESLSPMSVPTDRTPTTAYAGLGVMVGGADGLIVAAANVEGGFHVGSALWLHALLATGSSSEFLGHGSGWIAEFGGGIHGFLREVHGQVFSDYSGVRLVHGTSRSICPLIR